MKKIMILGAGMIQVPVIMKAKELGFYIIVIDFDLQAPGIRHADEFYAVSTNDQPAILKVAKEKKIDGILTTSDYPVNVVAYVARELGLPGMSVEIARICTDKYLQRDFFKNHHIQVPQFLCTESILGIEELNHYPYIVKPVDSSASRGVKKVNSKEELIKQFGISRNNSRSGKVIIEEYIPGKEYSVETLSQHGKHHIIQITEKLTIGEEEGYFVEDTHIEPAELTEIDRAEIEKTVYEVLNKMQVDNCPTHTELKINKQGVFIIEIACRLGGDYITSDLVPLSTGVDMLENLIKLSLGTEIDTDIKKKEISAVQFLNNKNYEKCVSFINSHNQSIVKSEIHPYQAHKIKSSMDRLGYIILNTITRAEMNDILLQLK